DEPERRYARGDQRGDECALAQAPNTDPQRVHLALRAKALDRGGGIAGQVVVGCGAVVARGFALASLVERQHRETRAREEVGKEAVLVAQVGAGSLQESDPGARPGHWRWKVERPDQSGVAARERNVAC